MILLTPFTETITGPQGPTITVTGPAQLVTKTKYIECPPEIVTLPGQAGHNETFTYTMTSTASLPGSTVTVQGPVATVTKIISEPTTVVIPGPLRNGETFTLTSTVTGAEGPVITITAPGPVVTSIVACPQTITLPAFLGPTQTITSTIHGPEGSAVTVFKSEIPGVITKTNTIVVTSALPGKTVALQGKTVTVGGSVVRTETEPNLSR